MHRNSNENLSHKLNDCINQSQEDEYCFVRMNYRNSISIEQIDEVKILQHNQIIYKGCLQNGDSFIFKSKRDPTESVYKLQIYLNEVFDDEMISCCEYNLMSDNPHDLFQIEQIIGSKRCEKCQSKYHAFSSSIVRSLDKNKSVSLTSISLENKAIHSSENQFEEEKILENFSSEKTNGPPRLSPMLSFNEDSSLSTQTSLEKNNQNQDKIIQISNSISQQYSNENHTSIINGTSGTLSNNVFEHLSNLLFNLLYPTNYNTKSSSNTVRREKGNVEWYNLIYLHSSSPDPSKVQKFRRLINIIKIFDDIDDCIAYINSLSNQQIILIVSENFCDSLLSRLENAFHISSIYVLSENLTFSSPRIRGVYQSIDDIYEIISNDINPAKADLLKFQPIYINRTALDTTFVFFQLLGDILLDQNENEIEQSMIIILIEIKFYIIYLKKNKSIKIS